MSISVRRYRSTGLLCVALISIRVNDEGEALLEAELSEAFAVEKKQYAPSQLRRMNVSSASHQTRPHHGQEPCEVYPWLGPGSAEPWLDCQQR